jgi:transketolase
MAQRDPFRRTRAQQDAMTCQRVVEQAATFGWERYVGPYGQSIGMQTFGASAPYRSCKRSSALPSSASWPWLGGSTVR